LKPLEAMAQGRLLLASNVGGHRELVRDGETGFLFAPDRPEALVQAVERALANRERWPAMRAAGRKFVETERNWRASVARYRGVYGPLTERRMHG
jgi:glycogen(starch) synthase